jgi:hypothetical protein
VRRDEALPTKFFRASDKEDGWSKVVTVECVRMETFTNDGKESKKPVAYFKRIRSGLVVGPVIWSQICEATGEEDSDGWIDKQLELFKDRTSFAGRMVDCVRVRKPNGSVTPKKSKKPAPSKPDFDDEVDY